MEFCENPTFCKKKLVKSTKQFSVKFLINFCSFLICKNGNPPACPEIRPIENFFGIAKQEVYDKNWKAKNRDQLIRRLKQKIPNMDTAPIIKMFEAKNR